jgi:myosin-light-chain kinase
MERCEGGELFTHIVRNRFFLEEDASMLCYEMLKAIDYIHSCNVVHRDIKAENFLFSSKSQSSRLVLIDFGMSIRVSSLSLIFFV